MSSRLQGNNSSHFEGSSGVTSFSDCARVMQSLSSMSVPCLLAVAIVTAVSAIPILR